MSIITADQKKAVKGKGFLANNDGSHFSARVITVNGVVTSEQARLLAEAADVYGKGELFFTSRMTVEIPGISYDNIEPFSKMIQRESMTTGGTGSRVRPVVACKGSVCIHGLIDTQGLAREIHEKFYCGYYDVKLPHKFKIGVGGCPNNCIKPDLNDFGIIGQRIPKYDDELCNGCRQCSVEKSCPIGAAKLHGGILAIDQTRCNNCGKCIGACAFDSVEEAGRGYKIYLGGKWGKSPHPGTPVEKLFTHDELICTIEKAILLYREQGLTGERFGASLERIGFENFVDQLLSDAVLDRKQQILDAPLHLDGGAKC